MGRTLDWNGQEDIRRPIENKTGSGASGFRTIRATRDGQRLLARGGGAVAMGTTQGLGVPRLLISL